MLTPAWRATAVKLMGLPALTSSARAVRARFSAPWVRARVRERGACAVEGYPDFVDGGSVGTLAMFADAGFAEVSQPGKRRAVMRIDF